HGRTPRADWRGARSRRSRRRATRRYDGWSAKRSPGKFLPSGRWWKSASRRHCNRGRLIRLAAMAMLGVATLLRDAAATVADIMSGGGIVMWPLLGLSILTVALSIERAYFWWSSNRRGRGDWVQRLNTALRTGSRSEAEKLLRGDQSCY